MHITYSYSADMYYVTQAGMIIDSARYLTDLTGKYPNATILVKRPKDII